MGAHMRTSIYVYDRGYGDSHNDPETDSDGDGGARPKLSGHGHIELSLKGIPHGSLHFPEQLKWAGHWFMFDTCAPEASHRLFIKKAMDRVRKGTDEETSESMVNWNFRTHTWGKIINTVERDRLLPRTPLTRTHRTLKVLLRVSKILRPTSDVYRLWDNTFSPLRAGGDNLMSPDARISYMEAGETYI